MGLIKCPECGKEISDLAGSCPNCGFPIGFEGSITKDQQQPYQQQPQYQNQQQPQYQQKIQAKLVYEEKKNSPLGIVALVFSILGITFWLGLILAVIDLCRKDGKKKTFSIAAVCVSVLWLVIVLIAPSASESDNKVETASETVADFDVETNKSEAVETVKPVPDPAAKADDIESENSESGSVDENESKEDFISSCEEIPYKTLARNPNDYIGKRMKLTVKVTQIVQGGLFDSGEYYRVYTNDEYDMWLGDEYFMSDGRYEKDMKILEDDILIVYAEFAGTETVTRALTSTKEEVPSVKAIYIDLIEDEDYNGAEAVEQDNPGNDGLTAGQRNALNQAKSYLEWSAFSYEGLIGQLEYEKYSHEEAVFAADNCGADWNEQAVKQAKSYLEFSSFSKEGLIEQLEYEGFTHEQAVYGAEQNGY